MSDFSDISLISNNMLLESKAILAQVKQNENDQSLTGLNKILKGTFFVLLYGAFEKTVTEVVERCIDLINASGTPIQNIVYCLLSIGLDSNIRRLQSSTKPQWEHRVELFSKIKDNENFDAITTLMPAQQGNFKIGQIQTIWDVFGLTNSVKNNERIGTTLSTLADNRNAIAHGREFASTIGGRYTFSTLEKYYDEVSEYCSYIINCFEDYINNETFKRSA